MRPPSVPSASHPADNVPTADKIRLFGVPTVVLANAEPGGLEWSSAFALLALLGCRPGWHSREQLAARVRPDATPDRSRAYLRQLLHRIKDQLPAVGALRADHGSLQWSGRCDVATFDSAMAARDWARAVQTFHAPFLHGIGTTGQPGLDDWFHEERLRLQGSLQSALIALLGQSTALAPESRAGLLQRLADSAPFDEKVVQFLLCQAQSPLERQVAAASYELFHRRIQTDSLASPTPETVSLYQRLVSAGGPGRRAASPANSGIQQIVLGTLHSPAGASLWSSLGTVGALPLDPAATEELIGREQELEGLQQLLHDPAVRLITVCGFAGVGKSALARCALARWARANGITVRTMDLADPAVLSSFPGALKHLLSGVDTGLTTAIGSDVLLLDNADGLDHEAALVEALAQSSSGVRVMVTARSALRTPHEHVFGVVGLGHEAPDDDAVQFLIQALQRAGYEPAPHDESSMGVLVKYLQGVPMALEMAARWAYLLPLDRILAEIQADFTFLDPPVQVVNSSPSKNRRLGDLFSGMWAGLSGSERRTLAALCTLTPVSATTARGVAAVTPSALLSLINKSMVQRQAPDTLTIFPLLAQFVMRQVHAT